MTDSEGSNLDDPYSMEEDVFSSDGDEGSPEMESMTIVPDDEIVGECSTNVPQTRNSFVVFNKKLYEHVYPVTMNTIKEDDFGAVLPGLHWKGFDCFRWRICRNLFEIQAIEEM